MRRPRHSYSTGDSSVDRQLRELVGDLHPTDARLVFETMATALRLGQPPITRLDRKIANTALKEMRYAFSVFAPYRHIRKVSIFGSARISKGDSEYALTRDFSKLIASRGWMVVTGAGPGIMEAGHEGAGGELSFGVNILLPFESQANPIIAGDPKLINFKYFFIRKLVFIKESDAFVLLPGGFGTMDELFELLTLMQTGKSDLHPIVMLDRPGGTYWKSFDRYLREELLRSGYILESDLDLFTYTDDVNRAMAEIEKFYSVYHSQRFVDGRLVLRLTRAPGANQLKSLSQEFEDLIDGPIETTTASAAELRDGDVPDLPRISLNVDRMFAGRMRRLIDRLNEGPV